MTNTEIKNAERLYNNLCISFPQITNNTIFRIKDITVIEMIDERKHTFHAQGYSKLNYLVELLQYNQMIDDDKKVKVFRVKKYNELVNKLQSGVNIFKRNTNS